MRVLFCRHAEAVDPSTAGSDDDRWLTPGGREMQRRVYVRPSTAGSDDDRWLTPGGREMQRRVASQVLELGVRVDRVLTSPLVRAVQSAELVARVHEVRGAIEVRRRLASGTSRSSGRRRASCSAARGCPSSAPRARASSSSTRPPGPGASCGSSTRAAAS